MASVYQYFQHWGNNVQDEWLGLNNMSLSHIATSDDK